MYMLKSLTPFETLINYLIYLYEDKYNSDNKKVLYGADIWRIYDSV